LSFQDERAIEAALWRPHRCQCPKLRVQVSELGHYLTLYQWNTFTAKHYFCRVCGIYTHHQRRSDPTQYGFNVACIEGVDPFVLGDIPIANGAAQTLSER